MLEPGILDFWRTPGLPVLELVMSVRSASLSNPVHSGKQSTDQTLQGHGAQDVPIGSQSDLFLAGREWTVLDGLRHAFNSGRQGRSSAEGRNHHQPGASR